MTRLINITFIALLAIPTLVNAQVSMTKKLVDQGSGHKSYGFFLAGGMTNFWANSDLSPTSLTLTNTTSFNLDYGSRGIRSPHFEVGTFVAKKHGIFKFMEVAVGYKNYRGVENMTGNRGLGSDISYPEVFNEKAYFIQHVGHLRLDFNMLHAFAPSAFVYHGPGADMEFVFRNKEIDEDYFLSISEEFSSTAAFSFVTYRAGLGFKTRSGKFIMFDVAAPVAKMSGPGTHGVSREAFTSTFRPYTLTMRMQWFKAKADRLCSSGSTNSRNGRLPKKKMGVERYPW